MNLTNMTRMKSFKSLRVLIVGKQLLVTDFVVHGVSVQRTRANRLESYWQ